MVDVKKRVIKVNLGSKNKEISFTIYKKKMGKFLQRGQNFR